MLVIRMSVAGLTQWVQVGGEKGFAGRVGFERIVEKCEKVEDGRKFIVES